jgi:CheY-like chemotaxis protein
MNPPKHAPPKLLLVEDELALAHTYRIRFQHEGYEVRVAADGLSAIETARQYRPDIILLDLLMPGLSGVAVLRQLKEHELTADTPVVVLSNIADDRAAAECLALGAESCLKKAEVEPKDVMTLVANILKDQR